VFGEALVVDRCAADEERGRYEADLVEPTALRHGSEEVADRAGARDTHALLEAFVISASSLSSVDRSRRYAEAQRRGRAGGARLSGSRAACAMIVTMAYDEDLANRIRELIASEDGYTEQKIRRHRLHDRRPHGGGGQQRGWPDDPLLQGGERGLFAQARCATFEMRGRKMKGWLRVDAESASTKRVLEPWAMQSVAFARGLPPKEEK
jgi:hypothetical protein